MCYDQEKTQVPLPGGFVDHVLKSRAERYADCGAQTVRPTSDSEILTELFKYHPPTPEQLPKYAAINQAAKNLAEVILQNCPPSADRSAAIRLIRDARMTANASVALNGLSL